MKSKKSPWACFVVIALAIMLLFSIPSCKTLTTPSVTATLTPTYSAPTLISPLPGATIVGEKLTRFSWRWDRALQGGETFGLRIWRPEKSCVPIAMPCAPSYLLDTPPDGFGQYQWQVAVVQIDESGSKSILSESLVWPFVWNDETPTSTPTPTGIPTSTPTSTPTDTVTPTPTPNATATATPTPNATATATPTPTATNTPTPTCTPAVTATPTPTPSLLPMPILSEPKDNTVYCPRDTITFKWEWNVVRSFRANEFYALRIWKEETARIERSRHWEQDRDITSYQTKPRDNPPPPWFEGKGWYNWNVVVLQDTGGVDKRGYKIWEKVSEESETRHFFVYNDTDPECWP